MTTSLSVLLWITDNHIWNYIWNFITRARCKRMQIFKNHIHYFSVKNNYNIFCACLFPPDFKLSTTFPGTFLMSKLARVCARVCPCVHTSCPCSRVSKFQFNWASNLISFQLLFLLKETLTHYFIIKKSSLCPVTFFSYFFFLVEN